MTYDIYDIDSANLVRSFSSEEEALAMVRSAVKRTGPESVETWALSRTDLTGEVISGKSLAEMAVNHTSAVLP